MECEACGAWAGELIGQLAEAIDDTAERWGSYDPLLHPDLNLVGPSGKKRRRLHKGFKDAIAVKALQDKRASSVSSMMRATCPDLAHNEHRLVHGSLREHLAATLLAASELHVVGVVFDGMRVGKPARELMPPYVWFARERVGSSFPPAVFCGRSNLFLSKTRGEGGREHR